MASRNIKCVCDACGFTFRAARKWLKGGLRCPRATCDGCVQTNVAAVSETQRAFEREQEQRQAVRDYYAEREPELTPELAAFVTRQRKQRERQLQRAREDARRFRAAAAALGAS